MPARKDDNKKPTATHADASPKPVPMDPKVEAKRSGPPPDATPKNLDGSPVTPAAHAPEPAPAAHRGSNAEIEAKLKDPDFDPSGVERLKLAEQLQNRPSVGPPTTDVDEHGNPMAPGETRG